MVLGVLYTFFSTVLFCIMFQIIMILNKRKVGAKVSFKYFVWIGIFLLYIVLVYSATGVGNIRDIGKYETVIRLNEVNMEPFESEGLFTYIANIIMFIPFGFLVPFIWDEYNSIKKIIGISFIFSFLIELSQLLNHRYTDIDDLLTNVIGATIGWLLFLVVNKFNLKYRKNRANKQEVLIKNEVIVYLIGSFLGTFIIYNPYALF